MESATSIVDVASARRSVCGSQEGAWVHVGTAVIRSVIGVEWGVYERCSSVTGVLRSCRLLMNDSGVFHGCTRGSGVMRELCKQVANWQQK